jgi:hypothetical protein
MAVGKCPRFDDIGREGNIQVLVEYATERRRSKAGCRKTREKRLGEGRESAAALLSRVI